MMMIQRDAGLTGGVGSPEMTEAERRVTDLVRHGRVIETKYDDPSAPRVKVGIGDPDDEGGYIKTGWLPIMVGRSNEWSPLKVGESVTVLSEAGEIQAGVVVPGAIHNEEMPAPGDRVDLWRKQFADGSVIEYDEAAGALKFTAKTKVDVQVGDASIHIEDGSIVLSAGGETYTIGSGSGGAPQ